MKPAAIYCRVSTVGQGDNASLATQEAECREYALAHGYTIVQVYCDVHTGAKLWERPRLTALRESMRRGEIRALICHSLDRLSRKQTHVAIIADDCERAEVDLHFVLDTFEKSAVGEFIRSAKAFAAELEREKIKERTQRGMQARLASGKPAVGARPLYGYRWKDAVKSGLEFDETTAPIVRRIFSDLAAGKTLGKIAVALNAEGIPAPARRGPWRHGALRCMVLHPGYTGGVPTTPPLIEESQAEVARAVMARNKAMAVRNNRNPEAFLLRSGFIVCGYCGKALSTSWEKRNTRRGSLFPIYRTTLGTHANCANPSIRAVVLDAAVWARVKQLLSDPDLIAAEVAKRQATDSTAADLATLDRALVEVVRQQGNLARAIAAIDDADAAAPLVAQMQSLGQRKRELEQEQASLAARHEHWEAAQKRLTDLAEWCGTVAGNLDALNYEQRRLALTALGVKVKLYRADHDPRYEITASIPVDRVIVASSVSASGDCAC